MPGDGSITFSDLIGKLDTLRVTCEKSARGGRYSVRRLIEQRGRDGRVIDLLAEVTTDCPRKRSIDMSDQCAVLCPDLSKVL